MTLEKSIQELDNLRNEEFERQRYDRNIWNERYPYQPSKLKDMAIKHAYSNKEVFDIINEIKYRNVTNEWENSNDVRSSKEDVQPLIQALRDEYPIHEKLVEEKLNSLNKNIDNFTSELEKLYLKHEKKLIEDILALANMQRNEQYLLNSKGISYPFILPGISEYNQYDEILGMNAMHLLSALGTLNYEKLYRSKKEFKRKLLSKFMKEEK